MIKSIFLGASAALAFAAMPAQAATVVYTSGQNVGLIESAGVFNGAFEANVVADANNDPSFVATFFFNAPENGMAAASAISIALSQMSNLDFTSIAINGIPGTVINGTVDQAFMIAQAVLSGQNTLTLTGNLNLPSGTGNAAFGGNVTFAEVAAVPEPATWALFILGFGALGMGMRRRNARVSATKATLNFA